jgi:hypothetical protein
VLRCTYIDCYVDIYRRHSERTAVNDICNVITVSIYPIKAVVWEYVRVSVCLSVTAITQNTDRSSKF